MSYQPEIQTLIEKYTRDSAYQELHWEGTVAQYLALITESPKMLRTQLSVSDYLDEVS